MRWTKHLIRIPSPFGGLCQTHFCRIPLVCVEYFMDRPWTGSWNLYLTSTDSGTHIFHAAKLCAFHIQMWECEPIGSRCQWSCSWKTMQNCSISPPAGFLWNGNTLIAVKCLLYHDKSVWTRKTWNELHTLPLKTSCTLIARWLNIACDHTKWCLRRRHVILITEKYTVFDYHRECV